MERVNTQSNERIDKLDFDAVSRLILIDLLARGRSLWLPTGRQYGVPNTKMRVLSGFTATQATDDITVTLGTAILSIYDEGTLKLGYISGDESPAAITVNMNGKGNGDWYLYLRAVILPADQENRVIWDPSVPSEGVTSMNSRLTPTWELVPTLSTSAPPGNGEYIPIHAVTMYGGSVTGLADMRHLFFHGSAAAADAHDHEWGDAAADRDGTNLIGDLHKFVQMVRRQLHDIITTAGTDFTGPLTTPAISLEKLGVEHSSSSGNHVTMTTEPLAPASTVVADAVKMQARMSGGSLTPTLKVTDRGHLCIPEIFIEDFHYHVTLLSSSTIGDHLPDHGWVDLSALGAFSDFATGKFRSVGDSSFQMGVDAGAGEAGIGIESCAFGKVQAGVTLVMRFTYFGAATVGVASHVGLVEHASDSYVGFRLDHNTGALTGRFYGKDGTASATASFGTYSTGEVIEARLTVRDLQNVLFEANKGSAALINHGAAAALDDTSNFKLFGYNRVDSGATAIGDEKLVLHRLAYSDFDMMGNF